jgi:hypothetical protein
VGDPADIAEALLFLMRSTFTTGQAVVVDDGTMLVSVWTKAVKGHSMGAYDTPIAGDAAWARRK